MEYIEKIKKILCKELDEYAMKSKFSMADVEAIHKLTDTVKNLDKIAMLEEDDGYSEDTDFMGTGRMYGTSYARGRGRYAKRDRMGRYSSDGGAYYDDYSAEMMDRHYSRDDAKDHLMHKLGEMMEDADPKQRKALEEAMHKIREA